MSMSGLDDVQHPENPELACDGSAIARILQSNQTTTELSEAKRNAEAAARIALKALDEADSANRAKSMFLATVSHELRTPLSAIIGFSDIMIQGLLDPAKGVEQPLEYAKDINIAGHLLLGLVNDILDLAKIVSGKLELQEALIDIGEMAGSCITEIQDRAAEAGVTLYSEIPDDCPALLADAGRLKQTLVNLLVNAIKFTPNGGDVRLTAGVEPDGSFAIFVSDNGIGIDPQNFVRVLEPFAQVDNGLNRGYAGSGLGLTLSEGLVELHGGSLTMESELGAGTTVAVRLPAGRIAARGGGNPGHRHSRKTTKAA